MKKVSLKGVTAELDPKTAGVVLKSTDRRLKGKPFKVTLSSNSGSYSSILNILKSEGAAVTEVDVRPTYRFDSVSQLDVPNRDVRSNIHIGKGIQDKDINLDLARAPSVLLSGRVGTGKSVGVRNIVTHGTAHSSINLVEIDLTRIELPHLHREQDTRVTDFAGAVEALEGLRDELRSRFELLEAVQVNEYLTTGLPAIYLIIEGVNWNDSEETSPFKPALLEILRHGRAAGIHTFFSSDGGLDAELMAQISTVILFGSNSSDFAHGVLGKRPEIGSALLDCRGRAIVQTYGDQELAQIGFMPSAVYENLSRDYRDSSL